MPTVAKLFSFIVIASQLVSCQLAAPADAPQTHTLLSPDETLQVIWRLDENGRGELLVQRRGVHLLTASLGLNMSGSGKLTKNLKVSGHRFTSRDRTYAIPIGKTSSARDRHNELIVSLEEIDTPNRRIDIAVRAFDEGAAFRYVLPDQPGLDEATITDELTRWTFTDDPSARHLKLKRFTTPYEAYYQTKRITEIAGDTDAIIGLPMLMRHASGNWLAMTEAALTDYAGLYLTGSGDDDRTLQASLSPLPGRDDGAKVVGRLPLSSPWRILMIADEPGRLIESDMVFHLNPPSQIEDTSWIQPGKTTFPWWNQYVLSDVDFEPGVNTATMKHYIDFCAEHGIPYHSLDGLDIAWYGGPIRPDGPVYVTTAAPSIDMPELLRYAREKGVRLRLWMHWKALQPQLDKAFATYEEWGIEGVMIDFMDRDDQEMVRWYHEVAEKAARRHLTVTWHGSYKPTGLARTWPNVLSYEGVLNQEYNKWTRSSSRGTPPVHNLDVAFVRMLAGPLDYHQGGMRNVLPTEYTARGAAPLVQGTRGHQLARYVVYQNHLAMMADYPAAYRDQPDLKTLIDIPSTWDETRLLHADIGRCIIIARRSGKTWYIGGMTADEAYQAELPLNFLKKGKHQVRLLEDDPAAGPTSMTQTTKQVVK